MGHLGVTLLKRLRKVPSRPPAIRWDTRGTGGTPLLLHIVALRCLSTRLQKAYVLRAISGMPYYRRQGVPTSPGVPPSIDWAK